MRTLFPALATLALSPLAVRADLQIYIAKPEPSFSWTETSRTTQPGCEIRVFKLISQEWQGIKWEHDLVIFHPVDTPFAGKVFLLNSGGKARERDFTFGATLAGQIKAPCALLMGIPNQPLFDGKKEDALIAETFVRYLETKDASWPLLFPMAKSLVKAMDAIQDILRKEWKEEATGFIVSGASKRGWTTWLTAAADPRVCAIAPMVIDTLNMRAQLPHQLKMFGKLSDSIRDYTERGLVPMKDTEEENRLWTWVDPFTYKAKFTVPKLIVLGTNDSYWSTDALNLYWDELPAQKWISYTANAGHNLVAAGGIKAPLRALNNIAAFTRHQITGKAIPGVTWKHDDTADGKLRLTVTASPAPQKVQLWQANHPGTDFRTATWESREVPVNGTGAEIILDKPAAGCTAFFADAGYEIDAIPYTLCTQMRIVQAPAQPARAAGQ
jgi:PhoPQ-activated pathogenicity-related protein